MQAITTWDVETYKIIVSSVQTEGKKQVATGVVVKPIVSYEYNSRGQVNLIDMQSLPVKNCKWIMVYQDHLIKLCILHAITSKRAAEVACQLMNIFLLPGAPVILQSDNGSEFSNHIITELKNVCSSLKLVHGRPCHTQSQGSIERANSGIKDMLTAWPADKNTRGWNVGIKLVQFQ